MCGIAGYIGPKQACPILIEMLKRLEYRGYDSAGLALFDSGQSKIYKEVGAIDKIEAGVRGQDTGGQIGFGHTRWATHGPATVVNAHPHHSENKRLTIVHNGTVINYYQLKEKLSGAGYNFYGDTDSEVLANFIDFFQKEKSSDLLSILPKVMELIDGRSVFVIHDQDNPDQLTAVNAGGELYIGRADDNQLIISSDKNALAGYGEYFFPLMKGQIAVLKREQLNLFDQNLSSLEPAWEKIVIKAEDLSRGSFPHFMLKEIFEQPETAKNTIDSLLTPDNKFDFGEDFSKLDFKNVSRIVIIACGTSWHAGLVAKYFFAELAKLPVTVEYASEFLPETVHADDLVIAISQSGSTADTIRAVELAKERGVKLLVICNVAGSTLARLADVCLLTRAGVEIGVASTKAFTTQLLILLLLALRFSEIKGVKSAEFLARLISHLREIPQLMKDVLRQSRYLEELSKSYSSAHNFLYLGRGLNFPIALEGALKLKEISYIHAEGLSAGEMKHGPIALIDHNMPVLCLALKDEMYDRVVNNILEVKARGGKVIAVTSEPDDFIASKVDEIINIPKTDNLLLPLLSVIPLQLLAYYIARLKGANIDKPRNLAKSVTVE